MNVTVDQSVKKYHFVDCYERILDDFAMNIHRNPNIIEPQEFILKIHDDDV